MKPTVLILSAILLLAAAACSSGEKEKYDMSDAQLGLAPQQAEGRRVYNTHCLTCHASYTTEGRTSMSLRGVFRKRSFASGIPANDERMAEVVTHGKRMMPAIPLTREQLSALLAYLHTL